MAPTPNQIAAAQELQLAQQALKNGEKHIAHRHAEQAARLAPEVEDVWLMLAALSTPRGSVACLERALQLNPNSERAQKGMAWAQERVRQETPRPQPPAPEKTAPVAVKPVTETQRTPVPPVADTQPVRVKPAATQPIRRAAVKPAPASVPPQTAKPPKKASDSNPRTSFIMAVVSVLCMIIIWVIWQGYTPVAALINGMLFFSGQPSAPSWAQVSLPKSVATLPAEAPLLSPATATPATLPTLPFTPAATLTVTPLPSKTPSLPTDQPSLPPTSQPTFTPLPPSQTTATPQPPEVASPTPLPTDTDEPAPTKFVPTDVTGAPGGNIRWIDVDLTNQTVYAYEGSTIVNSFIVSTGTWQYPTVTGQYRVYIKYLSKDMSGPGYYLPNVPYTMFFYEGYAIHGTYWHSNFGTPMSHGCVNLTIPDSEWLYNFSSVGTLVNVHY